MILAAVRRVTFAALLLGLATGARADVLEIGPDGARWVAGPLVQSAAADPALVDAAGFEPVVIEGVSVPDSAIADPARHAAGVPLRYTAKIQELAARFDLSAQPARSTGVAGKPLARRCPLAGRCAGAGAIDAGHGALSGGEPG